MDSVMKGLMGQSPPRMFGLEPPLYRSETMTRQKFARVGHIVLKREKTSRCVLIPAII